MIRAQPIPSSPVSGGPCFCCRRRDDGLGLVVPGRPNRIIWSCADHIHLAEKARHMPRKELDLFEQQAMGEAGDAAGAYLDSIGRTDLAALDQVQWVTFCKTMITTFGTALEKRLQSTEAPF